ncbi:MAG: heat shock protein HtpX [Elusimicrobia bacterium]|nr:MAG: heat shock protein HtpX [Elusimicrobiota bacterium]
MAFMKRIVLFMAVNLAVVLTISVLGSLLGIRPYLSERGIDYGALLALCALWGFAGSFISLQLSRWMAKRAMGVHLIDPERPGGAVERSLVEKVRSLSMKAGIDTLPEIGIYESPEVNAFATGPSKNRALVCVSTGLLERMDNQAVEGVLGHEISHVANGDMVTMTLVQGVVNTFVMFFARILAFAISNAMGSRDRDDDRPAMGGFGQYMLVMLLESVLMMLASPIVYWVSRRREYRADAGSAHLTSRQTMIHALESLAGARVGATAAAPSVATMMIHGEPAGLWSKLYSSHPPLESRVAALRQAIL